ncbi:hypothetical protein H6A07_03665 [Olsenella uli]|uniref:hypothetical protein n=1 Tax=Olsenella uli TaxID=133926 RepID=UPI001958EA14|nr:hypothetical protein [Olsenella uli]MBM6675842.1 hypothetical protein [Olsenella uli]
MDVPAILNLIETIDRQKITSVKELLEYHDKLPTHNPEYVVDGIDEALDDPAAITLICTHLLLKRMKG